MPEPNHEPVINATDVRYRFPGAERLTMRVPAFAVASGEHSAIVGPSGCGKTTLLRLLAGVLLPQSGSVRTLGVEPASLSPGERGRRRLRTIGMVFQDFALLDYISALDNILLTARLGGFDLGKARERAHTFASHAGIEHTLRRRPARLSQGERQRVAVCRALVTNPKLVLCDEPTGNLDPERSGEIIDLVVSEADAIGATVIAVTHDRAVLGSFKRSVDLGEVATLERGQR